MGLIDLAVGTRSGRRSFLAGLLGGLLLPKAAAAQTTGASCTAGEVGTLRRGTGADANKLLFCTDADLGGAGGSGGAKAWVKGTCAAFSLP